MTLENDARSVVTNLIQSQMTVFLQGTMHTEFNSNGSDAMFAAWFANEDPGGQQRGQTLFSLEGKIVAAALGLGGGGGG